MPPPPVSRSVPPPAASAGRPKFSFAEDEAAASRRDMRGNAEVPTAQPPRPALGATTPPLTPPRPALGGERSQPPFLRPTALGGSRTQPPPYRPIDPATGYAPPPRVSAPQQPQRGYGVEQNGAGPGFTAARPPVRRAPALDPYARTAEPRGFAGDEYEEDPRSGPRLSRPPAVAGRGRQRPVDEDYEEVFEEDPMPRQRASARDYQNAYREQDGGGYEEEQRRSSGPWLLLLALLVAALVTGGVVWFYNTKMKTVATTGATATDQVPVVEAPGEPVKTAPEQPADLEGAAPGVKKKQIYDRIVGDQEVTGDQVMPTEEIPVQPAGAQPEPASGLNQIPAPDVPGDATGITDEPAPLPLPPPPGNDQQGSLDQTGIEKIAAAAAQPEQGSTAPPAAAPPAASSTSSALPPPEPTTAGAEIASETIVEEPEVVIKPVKKKEATKQVAAAAKKKAAAAPEEQDLGAEPVVLVPPAEPIAPPSQSADQIASSEPISQQGGAAPAPAKKKKTILDLFRGSDEASAGAPAQAAPSTDETQVASLPAPKKTTAAKPAPAPEPEATPQQASTGGSGYVVQLASFRSQAEAQSEYGRLSSLYPTVVGGLPQRVAQSKVGGSTRYQLGLGPLKSRSEATRVCSALFQAGERDCIVRSQ
jgi:hypothetical protein